MTTKSNITDMAVNQNFFLQFEETFSMIWSMVDDILNSFKSIAELILELTFSYKNGEIIDNPAEQSRLCKTKLNLVLKKLCAQEENLKLFGTIFENLPDIFISIIENYLKSSVEKGAAKIMAKLPLTGGSTPTDLSSLRDDLQQVTRQSIKQGIGVANTAATTLGTGLIEEVKKALVPMIGAINPFKSIIDIITQQTIKIKNEILKTLGIKDPCANSEAFSNSLCENIVRLDKLEFVKLVKLYSQLIIDFEHFWSQLEIFFNLKFFDNFLVDEEGNGQLGNKIERIRNVVKKVQELGSKTYLAGAETFKVVNELTKKIETEAIHIIPGTIEKLGGGSDQSHEIRQKLNEKLDSLMKNYLKGGGLKKTDESAYNIIIHPVTNIKYSVYSHMGKQIINTYRELFNY